AFRECPSLRLESGVRNAVEVPIMLPGGRKRARYAHRWPRIVFRGKIASRRRSAGVVPLGEEIMGRINWARVVVGGLVAAVILFVAGFIIHGAVLGSDWMAWQQAGHMPLALSHGEAVVIWVILSLVNGITGVWIYAGIRPRYGAGATTALI